MKSHRPERLAEKIRMELGRLISRDVRDPRVGFTTITAVNLTRDLRQARVMISVIGTAEEEEESLRRLRAASRFLRHELSRSLTLRFTPELSFELDRTYQNVDRVEELLKRIKK